MNAPQERRALGARLGVILGIAAAGLIGVGITVYSTAMSVPPKDPGARPTTSERTTDPTRPPAPQTPTDAGTGTQPGTPVPPADTRAPSDEAGGSGADGPATGADGTGQPGGSSTGPGAATATSSAPPTTDAAVYTFDLPPSDLNPDGNVAAYDSLHEKDCPRAESFLVPPYQFTAPRLTVLFQAGYSTACSQDPAKGLEWTTAAIARYGTVGLGPDTWIECKLYRSLRSVQLQQPRTSFDCPAGSPPSFTVGPTGLVDDPLTLDEDESVPPPTPPTGEPAGTAPGAGGEAPETTATVALLAAPEPTLDVAAETATEKPADAAEQQIEPVATPATSSVISPVGDETSVALHETSVDPVEGPPEVPDATLGSDTVSTTAPAEGSDG